MIYSGTGWQKVGDPASGAHAMMAIQIRSSWLNCALLDGDAVYWVSTGHYEAVAVGSSWLTDSFTHRL